MNIQNEINANNDNRKLSDNREIKLFGGTKQCLYLQTKH